MPINMALPSATGYGRAQAVIRGQKSPVINAAQPSETTKGSSAIVRALLIANVNSRWWTAQFPVILLGMILPRSVTKSLRVMGFL
jgi:hypothetical protein